MTNPYLEEIEDMTDDELAEALASGGGGLDPLAYEAICQVIENRKTVSCQPVETKENKKTPREDALSRISTAFWATIVLVAVNGGLRIFAALSYGVAAEEVLVSLLDPLAMLALAFWLLRGKSRTAAILLPILFLLGKLSFLFPLIGVDLSPSESSALAKALARQAIWIFIFGKCYWSGIVGSFSYQRHFKCSQME